MTLEEALQRLADPALSRVQARHRRRLEAVFRGKTPERPMALQGIGVGSTAARVDPRQFVERGLVHLAEHAERAVDEEVFRPLLLCCNPHEVHFIDDLFGAEVFWEESSSGWQVRPFRHGVGHLRPPDLESRPAWRLVREVARVFLEIGPSNVSLVTPTLSSPLNIGVNLLGQDLLAAMLADPGAATADLRVIAEVILECHRWYLDNVPAGRLQPIAAAGRFQPPGHGQLCGCTTHLVGPDEYARFVAPLDGEILSLYPGGGMVHLCGAHVQHIPVWRSMRPLKCVQTNDRATVDLAAYFEGLRDDQVLYAHACDEMSVSDILEATSGGIRTVLVADWNKATRQALRTADTATRGV